MKIKSILLTAGATIGLATATMAQVPNYVPTNGLVGWWPFTGNANDESGNGNNGTVNGATLTTDRFGISNSAYSFDGTTNYIEVLDDNSLDLINSFTISAWVNIPDYSYAYTPDPLRTIIGKPRPQGGSGYNLNSISLPANSKKYSAGLNNQISNMVVASNDSITLNTWNYITATYDGTTCRLFRNNLLITSSTFSISLLNSSNSLFFGKEFVANNIMARWFKGKLDDIGIWNRALTQQEITDLYNAVNCANNTTITPQTNSLQTGTIAIFTATTSDPSPSYVWQSNFGQGFQTLNNFGNYSGVNTATLNISNVQLSEHNQPIRVISTSGNCIDTSNAAVINILDTCITNITIYDTLLTTVTDTLVINATITGLNPPNNLNTIKVFPNPANDHITINYGNFASMSGYTLKIINNLGQVVFTTPINQQSSYIDLSTWSGNGIYFVQIIDTQNNTIENRKIVLQ